MKNLLFILSLFVVSILAFYLLSTPSDTYNGRPIVATTIFPIYDITKNIVGDKVDVVMTLPAGANPHTFEPTPSMVREVQNASIFFKIGYGLDDWVDNLASQSNTKRSVATGSAETTIQRLDDGISLRIYDGQTDPHYWLTIQNAKIIATNITSTLIKTYPEYTDEFQKNLVFYLQKLDNTNSNIKAQMELIENKNIVTMHDAWYYFADAYDLKVIGTFEPSSGKEPTPQYLADLLTAIKSNNIKTTYFEPQSSIATFASFASDNNLEISELDDLGGSVGRESYIELMNYNAQIISQN